MDEPKSFFSQLDPKSALLVGFVGGILSIGTIGFIVLATLMLKGWTPGATGVVVAPTGGSPVVAAQPSGAQPAAPNVPKTSKPKVELFVMSYCPYGLQMEKAFVPAWELLKSRADIDVKFVSYAMHGKKEVDENTRQYCIETEQGAKYQAYLKCFFGAGQNNGNEAKYQQCLNAAGINQSALASCIARTDKNFGITAKYNDQGSWLSGRYPVYPIHADLNTKYGVQGSPTLVINGVEVSAGRTPEAVKQAICGAFTNPPAECQQALSNSSYGAGFGTELSAAGSAAAQPGCGT
ncbi:MAG: hypothetical protein HY983_04465 [Candidatus Magasanikbacteria bacterium]|nr:hypothetical protein [Candidatus Magasanikbacteria bacterium]